MARHDHKTAHELINDSLKYILRPGEPSFSDDYRAVLLGAVHGNRVVMGAVLEEVLKDKNGNRKMIDKAKSISLPFGGGAGIGIGIWQIVELLHKLAN